jgi:hypothetical protein
MMINRLEENKKGWREPEEDIMQINITGQYRKIDSRLAHNGVTGLEGEGKSF